MSAAPIIVRFGAFGDMVLLLPLMRLLAAHHGRPLDVVSSGGWTRPLLTPQSCVADVRLLTSRKAPYWFNASQREFVAWLRSRTDAPVYLCETDAKSKWLIDRAGVGAERLHWAGADAGPADEHWIHRWLRLGAQWTGQPYDPAAVPQLLRSGWLEIPEAARADCADWLRRRGWQDRPLVLLQPGSKRTMRRGRVDRASNTKFWPQAHWAQLARRVLDQQPEAQILICGSPEEVEFVSDIEALAADPRVCGVADDLPIPRLLALQACAQSMISVDTGPAHAAAAVGCPLVVLFGEMNPARWRPYAVQARVELVRSGSGRIETIAIDDVVEAWQRLEPATNKDER